MNKPKFPNKRLVLVASVILCLGLIAGALVTQALTPSQTFYISSGIYPSAPSYTVWEESGYYYYAKDSTGQIDFTETNCTLLFQQCVDALTNGGLIYVKNGNYSFDSTVTVSKGGVYIEGENWGHHESAGYWARGGVAFVLTVGTRAMFNWTRGANHNYFGGMKNLVLDGQDLAVSTGIIVSGGASDLTFENLLIDSFSFAGLHVCAHVAKTWNIWIKTVLAEHCTVGFLLDDTLAYDTPPKDYDVGNELTKIIDRVNIELCNTWDNDKDLYVNGGEIHNVLVTDNQFYGAGTWAVYIEDYARRVQLIANRIYDYGRDLANTYDGIYIGDSVSDVIITGNFIGNHWSATQRYAIILDNFCDNILVANNDFPNYQFVNMLVLTTGTNVTVHFNRGFVTENWGIQASCINGTEIAHGLNAQPTSVTLGIAGTNPYINATAWYFVPTVRSWNATHFIVSFCMNIEGTYTPVGIGDAKTVMWEATVDYDLP